MGKPEGGIRLTHSDASPIEVDLDLASFEGMGWIRRRLRWQSGWMQVAMSTMDTYWGQWSTRLVVAVTDKGELLGKAAAEALLQMRGLDLREPEDMPDDMLEGHLEMAHWDFLGRCDVKHLALLDNAEADLAAAVEAEQDRGETVLNEVEAHIAQLNRRRRQTEDVDTRNAIMDRVALLENKHAAAAAWLVRRLASMREAGEQEQADMLEMLQNHGHLHVMQTVRWVARHPADRPSAEPQVRGSFSVRSGVLPEDWRGSAPSFDLLRRMHWHGAIEPQEGHAWITEAESAQPVQRDAAAKLIALSRNWINTQEIRHVEPEIVPSPDRPPSVSDEEWERRRVNFESLRTKAQEVSAKRRAVQQQREREVAEVLEQYPTLGDLERALDATPSTGIENRRRARVLREAIARLSPRSVVVAQPMQPSPLAQAMPTPLPEPVAPVADDSADIDALIDQTLRDMLKDLT